jgi:hypothetical protein
MKKPFLPLTKLTVAIIAGIGFAPLLVAQPSLADYTLDNSNSFPSINSDNNSNPLSPGNGSSDFNMMDLIHRANFGTVNWNDSEQNQKLDDAAAAFKKQQEQRFQNPQKNATPGLPLNAPSANKLLLLPSTSN